MNDEMRVSPCVDSVYDRNTRRSVGKFGWKAMPSNPCSPPDTRRPEMFTTSDATGVPLVLNFRTTPFCWTMNQREPSPGACSITTGEVKVRFVYCVVVIDPPALGLS